MAAKLQPYFEALRQRSVVRISLQPGRPATLHGPSGASKAAGPSLSAEGIAEVLRQLVPGAEVERVRKATPGTRATHEVETPSGTVRVELASGPKGLEALLHSVKDSPAGVLPDDVDPFAPAYSSAEPPIEPLDDEVAKQESAPDKAELSVPELSVPERSVPEQKAPSSGKKAPPPKVGVGKPAHIDDLFSDMFAVAASDLHLKSDEVPIVRIDGDIRLLEFRTRLDKDDLWKLVEPIMPAPNRDEFAERSDTDFAYDFKGRARIRCNVYRDLAGIAAAFRQIPNRIRTPKELGLPDSVIELCGRSKGLVLVTGATGSGKSTTLAALIDYLNATREEHIITIEDPVEFVHPRKRCLVNQREIGTHTQSFKAALRAALREDPDVVLVGELRDLETMAIALETAETGHLVFGTLHTNSASATVDRLIDQFPADRQAQIRTVVAEALLGVVSQTLARRKEGGRAAVYEVMINNHAIANLIREAKTVQIPSIMQTARASGMQTFHDSLLELVKKGEIEAEEAYACANDKKAMAEALKALGFDEKGVISDGKVIVVVCPRSPPAPVAKLKRRKDIRLEFLSDVAKVTPETLNKNVALVVFQWVETDSSSGTHLATLCKEATRFGVPVLAIVPRGRIDLRAQAFGAGASDVVFVSDDKGFAFEVSASYLAGLPVRKEYRRALGTSVRVSIAGAPWKQATLEDLSRSGARITMPATADAPPPKTTLRVKVRDDAARPSRNAPQGLALREVELFASVLDARTADGTTTLRVRFTALSDEDQAWLTDMFQQQAAVAAPWDSKEPTSRG